MHLRIRDAVVLVKVRQMIANKTVLLRVLQRNRRETESRTAGRWRQQAQLPDSFLALGRVERTKNISLENSCIERPVLTQA